MSNFEVGDAIKLNKRQHMPLFEPDWVEGKIVKIVNGDHYVIEWSDGFQDDDEMGYMESEFEAI